MSKRLKKASSGDDENEFIKPSSATAAASEPDEDETPSLEKHGFMIYPLNPPDACLSKQDDRSELYQALKRPKRRETFPEFAPATGCCCCCCHCSCHFYMPAPNAKFVDAPRRLQKQKQRRNRSSPSESDKSSVPPAVVNSVLEEVVEDNCFYDMELASTWVNDAKGTFQSAVKEQNAVEKTPHERRVSQNPSQREDDVISARKSENNTVEQTLEDNGMKDMELASICVNDAKGFFQTAIKEETKEEDIGNKRMQAKRSDDTVVRNKAAENFAKCVKDEKIGQAPQRSNTLQFEEVQNDDRGVERVISLNSTVSTNKAEKNFRKNVADAETENKKVLSEKLKRSSRLSRTSKSSSRRRRKQSEDDKKDKK